MSFFLCLPGLKLSFSAFLFSSLLPLTQPPIQRIWFKLKCPPPNKDRLIFIQWQFQWLTSDCLVLKLDLHKAFAFHLLHYTIAWITEHSLASFHFFQKTWHEQKWLCWHLCNKFTLREHLLYNIIHVGNTTFCPNLARNFECINSSTYCEHIVWQLKNQ